MLKGIVVAQTHWDREWYLPFQVFRYRLLHLIDTVLDLLETDSLKFFTTDGQTIMVEDYLDVYPEKREKIRELVKAKRLHVGPWYVLPDEFLVSGEALIRNLMIGHRQATKLGRVMKAGYIPDPFGHISQLPAIMRGFGITSAIFGRGMGDEGASLPSEFRWASPGGEEVLAVHLITGYGNYGAVGYEDYDRKWGEELDFSLRRAIERTERLIDKMQGRTLGSILLFNNGSDHLLPQKEMPLILNEVNRIRDDIVMEQGTYEDFVNEMEPLLPTLPAYFGEMRGARFNNLLSGVLSARMYIKQKNHRAQAVLEKYTEPFLAWAESQGYAYPRRLLWMAWELLLQNHPHDSICGCSIDQVHREMIPRFDQAIQIGEELSKGAASYLTTQIAAVHPNPDAIVVVAYNPHNWTFCGPLSLTLELDEKASFQVADLEGNGIPQQSNGQWVLREQGRPPVFRVELIWNSSLPPCGYKTFWLVPKPWSAPKTSINQTKPNNVKWENELLRLEFNDDGTIEAVDKTTNQAYNGLLCLESKGDVGDEYDFAKPISGEIVSGLKRVNISIQESGPIRTIFRITGILSLPTQASEDRKRRSDSYVDCPVEHILTVFSKTRGIHVKTTVENKAKDHRLRVIFPVGDVVGESVSEGHFDVLLRSASPPPGENWFQPPVGYHPQQTWTACSGLLVANKGLPEYEITTQDSYSQLELTLLRCVGYLSRNDHSARPGDHAGPGFPTPEAQCLGTHTFEYAVFFFDGDWEKERVWQNAHQYVYSPRVIHGKQSSGPLKPSGSFPHFDNAALIVTAIKPSDSHDGLIIRAYNPTFQKQEAKVVSDVDYALLVEVNLSEQSIATVNPAKSLTWGPKQIRTFKVVWSNGNQKDFPSL